nr:uncharacterized protein LOC129452965 [Misgurnus anguillicaudatus]
MADYIGDKSDVEVLRVNEEESVNLETEVTDIKRDDVIEWKFGDEETPIAQINPSKNISSTSDKGLFRDKLKLNHQTGDLTIKDIRQKHTGVYKLKITRGGKTSYKTISVFVRCAREDSKKTTGNDLEEKTENDSEETGNNFEEKTEINFEEKTEINSEEKTENKLEQKTGNDSEKTTGKNHRSQQEKIHRTEDNRRRFTGQKTTGEDSQDRRQQEKIKRFK